MGASVLALLQGSCCAPLNTVSPVIARGLDRREGKLSGSSFETDHIIKGRRGRWGEVGSVLRESEVEAREVNFFVAVRLALEERNAIASLRAKYLFSK